MFRETLPLHAEVDDEGDAADQRHGAAEVRNGRQRQQVANWPHLELLCWRGAKIVQEILFHVSS